MREIWIDQWRFEGSLDVAGRFHFKPLRLLEVGPLDLQVAHGALRRGPATILDTLEDTRAAFTLSRLDMQSGTGRDFIRHSSLDAFSNARFPDLGALPWHFDSGVALEGVALSRSNVHVASGVVETGTRIDLVSPMAIVTSRTYRLAAATSLSAIVTTRSDGSDALRIDGELSSVDAAVGRDREQLFHTPRVVLRGAATDLDLGRVDGPPLEDTHVEIVAQGGELDARVASRILAADESKGMPIALSGAVDVDAFVDAWPAQSRASAVATLHTNLSIVKGEASVGGRVTVGLAIDAYRFDEERIDDASVTLDSEGASMNVGDAHFVADVHAGAHARDVDFADGALVLDTAHVDLDALAIRHRATSAASVGRIVVNAESPRVKLADPLRALHVSASVTGGKVIDTHGLEALLPSKPLRLVGGGASFEGRAEAHVVDHVLDGTFTGKANRIGVGTYTVQVTGDVDVAADIAGWDLGTTTLIVRHASATGSHLDGRFVGHRATDFRAARVDVDARASRFDFERPTLSGVDLHVSLTQGELPDARALASVVPPNATWTIESGSAWLAADLAIHGGHEPSGGWIEVGVAHGELRLQDKHFTGDLRAFAALRATDTAAGVFDLTGSQIALRDVVWTSAREPTPAATVDVAVAGTVRFDPRPVLDANARLDGRDTGAILSTVSPGAIAGAFLDLRDVRELDARLRIIVAPQELALLDIDARGGNLAKMPRKLRGEGRAPDRRLRGDEGCRLGGSRNRRSGEPPETVRARRMVERPHPRRHELPRHAHADDGLYPPPKRRKFRTLIPTMKMLIATSASTFGRSSNGVALRRTTPRMISIMCVAGRKRPIHLSTNGRPAVGKM